MKRIVLLSVLLIVSSCSTKDKLYLDKENYQFKKDLKMLFKNRLSNYYYYKKYRKPYLGFIDSLRQTFPNDTLFLAEFFEAACECPPKEVFVNVKNQYYYKQDETTIKKTRFEPMSQSCKRNKIYNTLRPIMKSDTNWASHISDYDLCGALGCFDSGSEVYTVIFPNDKVITRRVDVLLTKEELQREEFQKEAFE